MDGYVCHDTESKMIHVLKPLILAEEVSDHYYVLCLRQTVFNKKEGKIEKIIEVIDKVKKSPNCEEKIMSKEDIKERTLELMIEFCEVNGLKPYEVKDEKYWYAILK